MHTVADVELQALYWYCVHGHTLQLPQTVLVTLQRAIWLSPPKQTLQFRHTVSLVELQALTWY